MPKRWRGCRATADRRCKLTSGGASKMIRDSAKVGSVPPAGAATICRWPYDYIAMDDGQLLIHPDYVPIFRSMGWTTVAAVMASDRLDVKRRVEQRDNCRLLLPRPVGGGEIRAYVKRHRSNSFGDWMAARLRGNEWTPPGIAEADAVGQCQAADVATMTVIAAGAKPGKRPWQAESFFMSEEIEGGIPADEFWASRMGPPASERSSTEDRLRLLEALAETARRLHGASLFHRDFYWCHFFVREPSPGAFRAHLIDLQRIRQSRWSRLRWLLKDLAQFRFSVPAEHVAPEEELYWYQCYRGSNNWTWRDRLVHETIGIRAALYRWKEGRK